MRTGRFTPRPMMRGKGHAIASVIQAGGIPDRPCACGGLSSLTGNCLECERKKLIGPYMHRPMRISEPGDAYEQEADRVAQQIAEGPINFLPAPHGSIHRRQNPVLQRKPNEKDNVSPASSSLDAPDKPELEFHSALHFNRTLSGFNPTSEPEAGGYGIIWWSVWNTGWAIAPDHTNRLTLYDARTCSGCRRETDEVFRANVPGESIVWGKEPGKSEYDNGVIVGPLSTGLYDAYVELDVDKQVDELNEDNNVRFMSFMVRPSKESESEPENVVQKKAAAGHASQRPELDARLFRTQAGGRPLDKATCDMFSAKFGHDFADVRVHADAEAHESATALNAVAFTVGNHIVFGAGHYAPGTRAGQMLLAHELTHVVQQGAAPVSGRERGAGVSDTLSRVAAPPARHWIQRQPKTEGPSLRDLPIFLERLEFDVGKNLRDYGHHLYRAAALYPDDPTALRAAFERYAIGANVLQDTFRFLGVKPDMARPLAYGSGILFKGFTFVRRGELTLDVQIDLGRDVKLETNLSLGVNPKDLTDVRQADVTVGLVRNF